jgi:hypothetical protein
VKIIAGAGLRCQVLGLRMAGLGVVGGENGLWGSKNNQSFYGPKT